MKLRKRSLLWMAALVAYVALCWPYLPLGRPGERPTVAWVTEVREVASEASPQPKGLNKQVQVVLGYDGPAPQLDRPGGLFRGRLICNARTEAVELGETDLFQAATIDREHARIVVDLTLKLAEAPRDAGEIALWMQPTAPWIAGPPIAVPVRLLTDSRGRPLPLGAIQRADNEQLKKVLKNAPYGVRAEQSAKEYFARLIWFLGALSPDGRFAMLSSGGDHSWLWDLGRGAVERLPGQPLTASHDGKTVALEEQEGNAALYDVATKAVRKLPIKVGIPNCGWDAYRGWTFSADDKRLFATRTQFDRNTPSAIAGRYCYEYGEWDAKTGVPVAHVQTSRFRTFPDAPHANGSWNSGVSLCAAFGLDRLIGVCEAKKWLLFVDANEHFRAWDIVKNKQVRDWALGEHVPFGLDPRNHTRLFMGAHITPDGRLITAMADEAGGPVTSLAVCDCDDGRCEVLRAIGPVPWEGEIYGRSPDRTIVAIDGAWDATTLLDASSGAVLLEYAEDPADANSGTYSVSFAEGNRLLIARREKGTVETTVWDLRRIRNAARQARGG